MLKSLKLILLLLFALSNGSQAQKDMKTIEKEDVEIAYHRMGEGDTTLLFIHGSFIDSDYWSEQLEYFKHDYTVFAIDLPGHGKSGRNRSVWTIREYGKDVYALINELRLKNVVLIGHSMGGDVALEVASEYPDAIIGFIGIDNFKNAGMAMPEEAKGQVDYILEMLKSDFANTSENYAKQVLLSASTKQSLVQRVSSSYRNMDKNIGVDLISDAFAYFERERELMKQLKHKIYLINVDNVPTNEKPLKKYAASGYDLISIKGTCHFPMIESPVKFNQLLQSMIAKIGSDELGSR